MFRRSFSRKPALKRRRTGPTRKYAKRVVGSRGDRHVLVRSVLPRTFTGGDTIIRRFRRMGTDCTILGGGVGIVATINSTSGAAPLWISAPSPPTLDVPSAPTLYEFGFSTQWTLRSVIDFSQLQTLFNEYQLNKIELHFSMDCADAYSQGNGNNPNTTPSVYIRYDPNDAIIPGTSNIVTSGGDCQYRSLKKPFVFSFYPRPAQAMYQAGISSGYGYPANNRQLWLDTSPPSDNIEHYGVKMWFRNFNTANQSGLNVRIQPVYFFTMRRIR